MITEQNILELGFTHEYKTTYQKVEGKHVLRVTVSFCNIVEVQRFEKGDINTAKLLYLGIMNNPETLKEVLTPPYEERAYY